MYAVVSRLASAAAIRAAAPMTVCAVSAVTAMDQRPDSRVPSPRETRCRSRDHDHLEELMYASKGAGAAA
ncbi:hypothetical protein [Streptomyces showdoensis]|uniref:hypothetical protein n=1 Tax=Streptomyces showdoensis TaxID=68268 RepID=UPI0031E9C9CD